MFLSGPMGRVASVHPSARRNPVSSHQTPSRQVCVAARKTKKSAAAVADDESDEKVMLQDLWCISFFSARASCIPVPRSQSAKLDDIMSALNNRFGKGEPPCMGELQHILGTTAPECPQHASNRAHACGLFRRHHCTPRRDRISPKRVRPAMLSQYLWIEASGNAWLSFLYCEKQTSRETSLAMLS